MNFLTGCAGGDTPQHPFVAIELNNTIGTTRFMVYHEGQWFQYDCEVKWTAVGMTSVFNEDDSSWTVLAADQTGYIYELNPLTKREITYKHTERLGITNISTIEGSVFVCGMGRYVAVREGRKSWKDISAPNLSNHEEIIGFTCIAGGAGQVFAVGWCGEVWGYVDDVWTQEDTPTTSNFNSICYNDNENKFYIVGDDGVIVSGNKGIWSFVDTNTDSNLLDVCVHDNIVYVTTDFSVHRVFEDILINEISGDETGEALTCNKLFSAEGNGLFSIGLQDILLKKSSDWFKL